MRRFRNRLTKPGWAFLIGACMEVFHLCVLLVMVRPIETALYIIRTIAFPFIFVNALGFTLMITIMTYIQNQQRISIAASMEPAKEVGGDFYDFFFIGREKLAVVIADVSGKGVPAALFMATAKLTLQNCLRDIDSLSEAVSIANDSLCRNNEAEMFVTAWIGVLDIASGRLDFISAGHNPPAFISGGTAVYLRQRSGFVLAGMEGMRYKEGSLDLKPGDMLFLYTDGITEAETAEHELYGEDRLLQCLSPLQDRDPEDVLNAVKASVAAHVRGNEQFDDMTMFCLKINE